MASTRPPTDSNLSAKSSGIGYVLELAFAEPTARQAPSPYLPLLKLQLLAPGFGFDRVPGSKFAFQYGETERVQ